MKIMVYQMIPTKIIIVPTHQMIIGMILVLMDAPISLKMEMEAV